ncbi:MAG: efflux RND transporter permease subunit [Pseudomonadales bacterium]
MSPTAKPSLWARSYFNLLTQPAAVIAALFLVCSVAAYYATQFRFDASSETLVVKDDPDLLIYERVTQTFSGDDFLLLTFEPSDGKPFTRENLTSIAALTDALSDVPGVANTFSALDIPLLQSPPVSVSELQEGFKTLKDSDVPLDLAAKELQASPLFRELLISKDGRSTAIQINLAPTTPVDLAGVSASEAREAYLQSRDELISAVRHVQSDFSHLGQLYLGGVPMIAADMIDYVRKDLQVFGGSVVLLMMLALYGFFRRARWVVLPMATSGITVLLTVGVLGWLDKPATVVSSNFIALLAIVTISLTIHLIQRYRELLHIDRDQPHIERVRETMRSKFAPCVYTSITTIAAFGSLMASRIVPVEDFGWMMCVGIAIGFVVTFLFFPAALLLIGAGKPSTTLGAEFALTRTLGQWSRWRSSLLILLSLLLTVIVGNGLMLISLDNRFVDYFAEETEIHRGMSHIDQQLGGTIPFDVVLTLPPYEPLTVGADEDDLFADEFADADDFPERYWFTRDKLDRLEGMHRFLQSQEVVGKVLSLTAVEDLARVFTEGAKLSNPEIAGILAAVPDNLRTALVDNYADPESGQLRLNARIHEIGPGFDRAELAQQIKAFAEQELGFTAEEVSVSGMMVLFDSMLKQLFDSQIDTLLYVLLATFIMLLILLRSVIYALIGLIPNILAAATVLASLGYLGIPLDMMTTTIAAISIGIGVDDAIHYLHRFQGELSKWGDARVAVSWSHASIGHAMYYTSITVMLGFSVMAFSNFVPTVLFGILVAVAMALALFANLTLLPSLLVWVYGTPAPEPVSLKAAESKAVD